MKDKKQKNGYTLMEAIVVMALIAILSAVVYANYNDQRGSLALQRSSYKVSQDLRRIETMPGLITPKCIASDYDYSYGIRFDKTTPSQYVVFADCDKDRKWSSAETTETFTLENNISIQSLGLDGGTANIIDIAFIPPEPTVVLTKDGGPTGDSATIVIQSNKNPSQTKTITINKVGMIDVK